jgi:hypothetical protein
VFRFLDLTAQAEALWKGGDEAAAAVGRLTTAAGLWGGEPFAGPAPRPRPLCGVKVSAPSIAF